MPELFLPLLQSFFYLFLHLHTSSLFSCLSAHDHPPFLSFSQISDACSVLPLTISKCLPCRRFLLYRRFCLHGGFWDATNPADLRLIVAFHVLLTVSTTIEHGKTLLLLLRQGFTQVRHHLGDDRTDTLFVCTIAIKRTQKNWDIPIMGGYQPQHPLFQISSVITRIPVDNGNGDRFLFFLVLTGRFPFDKILSIHGKRGRIDMYLFRFDPEALTRLEGQSRKQGRHIMLVEPIQRSSQTIIIEHIGSDPLSQ